MRYLTLAEALTIAEAVTGIDADVLARASRVELLDSALHAPQAGFGDQEFYPRFVDKAAVLAVRISRNHPLPGRLSRRRSRDHGGGCRSQGDALGRALPAANSQGQRRRAGEHRGGGEAPTHRQASPGGHDLEEAPDGDSAEPGHGRPSETGRPRYPSGRLY